MPGVHSRIRPRACAEFAWPAGGKLSRMITPRVVRRAGTWLAWWVLLMSLWEILDDSIATDELLAGAGAAALAAFVAEFVGEQAQARFRMRVPWLAQAFGLPARLARDTIMVFAALWRLLARGERPQSVFRSEPVRPGGLGAEATTRRVLLMGGRSFTPNTFVLGIDADTGLMVVHDLVASPADGSR
jgi:multisubunit Na+/H+ antiporter MnhE subunit